MNINKMIKTQTEQTEYLKTLNFSIKDFYATSLKYEDYKDQEFKQFLKDNETEINFFLQDLNQEIFMLFIHNRLIFENCIKDNNFKSKSDIRQLKTYVNDKTQYLIIKFLEENINYNLNNNTKRNFCIKFYLNFYDLVNEEMKKALIEIVENQTEDF